MDRSLDVASDLLAGFGRSMMICFFFRHRWEGKIVESQEVKVILKTPLMHYHAIQSYILNHCSYEVPEIVQVDINQGNPSYLSWIFQETEL